MVHSSRSGDDISSIVLRIRNLSCADDFSAMKCLDYQSSQLATHLEHNGYQHVLMSTMAFIIRFGSLVAPTQVESDRAFFLNPCQ